jgi:hypothetical protein
MLLSCLFYLTILIRKSARIFTIAAEHPKILISMLQLLRKIAIPAIFEHLINDINLLGEKHQGDPTLTNV